MDPEEGTKSIQQPTGYFLTTSGGRYRIDSIGDREVLVDLSINLGCDEIDDKVGGQK